MKKNYFAFKVDDIEEAHSHVNFQDLASDRAAYRLADQFDQDVLGYLSGYKQSALHGTANAVNTTVNGSKAVTSAGSDELLATMKLDASELTDGQIYKLVGSTKGTVSLIRKRSYWNFSNLKPRDPVILALCTQETFQKSLEKAKRRVERERKAKIREEKKAQAASL